MAVYLLRCGDVVKIGFSNNISKRLSAIKTAAPGKIELMRLLDGDVSLERALHHRFKDRHETGEWFRFTAEMLGDLGAPDLAVPAKVLTTHRLARYLATHGISISDFAAAIGVSVQAVYRYAHGERVPHRSVMQKIAEQTCGEVQPNDFFERAVA